MTRINPIRVISVIRGKKDRVLIGANWLQFRDRVFRAFRGCTQFGFGLSQVRLSHFGLRTSPSYGSAVTATKNGCPGVGLSDVKSNCRSGTSGNGFSQVVLNNRTLPPLARTA